MDINKEVGGKVDLVPKQHKRKAHKGDKAILNLGINPLRPELLCTLYIKMQSSVLTSRKARRVTTTQISWLMLSKETIPVHTKPINNLCEECRLTINKPGGAYSYHWTYKA
jgi:hypothetical protein